LESKIINMADRLKDEVDTSLESLFGSEPVQDDGFSVRVVARVRRQMWVRRLSLPFAFVIGVSISAKPLIQFADALPALLGSLPVAGIGLDKLPLSSLPPSSTIVMGIMLLATVLMVSRILEE
jgi:hypothetical protein